MGMGEQQPGRGAEGTVMERGRGHPDDLNLKLRRAVGREAGRITSTPMEDPTWGDPPVARVGECPASVTQRSAAL